MKADLYSAQARVTAGNGLAHRTGAGFIVLTSADGGDMIALIDAKQNESDLIDQIVATAQTGGHDAFAMLFTAGGDLYLIASGAATSVIESPSMRLVVNSRADHVVVHPIGTSLNETAATIHLHLGTSSGSPAGVTDFERGTTEADGVYIAVGGASLETLAPLAAPTDAGLPAVVVDPAPVADSTPASVGGHVGAAPEQVAAPAPTPAPAPPAGAGPVMVLGVACSQGHHNHPDAVYCSQCGTKMGVHHTTVLLNGPRPPLGVLVIDDGTTYSLGQDLVIGREPTSHDDVVAGIASPMILTDDTLSLSRKHARIVLDDWSVFIQDLGSSNGTYLSRAGQAENWTRVAPASTLPLEPGDRLRVGGRIIQVELHHIR